MKALTLAYGMVNSLALGSSGGTMGVLRHHMLLQDDIPFNQMHPASRIDNPTDLSRLERKSRLLKLLLHVPVPEESPCETAISTAPATKYSTVISER